MKITKTQLKRLIKEELGRVTNEKPEGSGIDPQRAKGLVAGVLVYLEDGMTPRAREPQGYAYRGFASVQENGAVGIHLHDKANYYSPAGGTARAYREKPQQPVDTKQIQRSLFNNRGLAQDLKEKGGSISSYFDDGAPHVFEFRGIMDTDKNVFVGYKIDPK